MLDFLSGMKTYLAAAGMFGLALYQALVEKDFATAYQSFLIALGATGVRHALTKSARASEEAATEAVYRVTRGAGLPLAVRDRGPARSVADEPKGVHPFSVVEDA